MTSKSSNAINDSVARNGHATPMTCLVTGAAGFIGSHLAEALLAQGYSVFGIDDLNDYYSPEFKQDNLAHLLSSRAFHFLRQDINAIEASSLPLKIDYVFHLAGQPGVRSSWSTAFDAYVSRNILATQRLLELIAHRDVRRFIFASSSSIYGQALGAVSETAVPHPLSPYAATKLAAEGLCLAYSAGYAIPVTILRYFTVYGPRQRPDMAFHKLLQAAVAGTPVPIFGDGTQRRAFTYVSDVVDATVAAMNERNETSVYNISGGEPATLNECLALIEETTRRRIIRQVCLPQRGDPFETEADISLARNCLGYRPRVPLLVGVTNEWQWMRVQMAAATV